MATKDKIVNLEDLKVLSDHVEGEVSDLKSDLADVTGTTTRNFEVDKNIQSGTGGGYLIDDTDSCVSEYIPLTWSGYAYYVTNDNSTKSKYQIAFYDSEKNSIQSSFGNPSANGATKPRAVNADTQVTLGTPAYVRFSFKKGTLGEIRLTSMTGSVIWKAEEVTTGGLAPKIGDLDELETTNKTNLVAAINEVKESVPESDVPITPEETTFFHISANLIDPNAWVSGQYVNQTNGNFANNESHRRTDYIAVNPNTSYQLFYKNKNAITPTRYAFYNSNKQFISGAMVDVPIVDGILIESPTNAAYIVTSNTTAVSVMLAETDEFIPFEDYSNVYILPQYIQEETVTATINIPSKIYATEGIELNVYFENITEDWTQYDWDITCTKGAQWARGFKLTPTASDAGTYPLTITATDKDGNSTSKTTSLIITAASAGSGVERSVIVLGDSTTNNGTAVTKLNENFADDVMSVSTLGTRGTAPNNHEGRSGWKLSDYFTVEYIDYTDERGHVENPFYNPTSETFDADYYFANSGIAKPDWFFINMGINDTFSFATDDTVDAQITTCINYVTSAITSIKSASPSTKIGVCLTIPPNHSQDAFGKAYDNGQTRNRYKRNNTLWVDKLIETFDSRESENIYLVPIHTNLDTVYNMGMETLPVNARNTAITYQSPIGNGGVHPVESGYWQIADVYTAFLKAQA